MGACPFCGTDVSEEILQYGGNCPSCFIEIPGDEAPTDVGQISADDGLDDIELGSKSNGLLFGVVAVLLVAGGVGGWWFTRSAPDETVAEVAQTEFFIMDAETIQSTDEAEEKARQEALAEAKRKEAAAAARRRAAAAAAQTENEGVPNMASTGLGPGPRTRVMAPSSAPLTDPMEIKTMVGTTLRRYKSQVHTCYQQRLKEIPTLEGKWEVKFTIDPAGTTSRVEVVSKTSVKDRALRECIKARVLRWNFRALAIPQTITQPYTLRPDVF